MRSHRPDLLHDGAEPSQRCKAPLSAHGCGGWSVRGNAELGPRECPVVLAGGDQDQGLLVPDLHLGWGWGETKAAQCPWKHEHTEACAVTATLLPRYFS